MDSFDSFSAISVGNFTSDLVSGIGEVEEILVLRFSVLSCFFSSMVIGEFGVEVVFKVDFSDVMLRTGAFSVGDMRGGATTPSGTRP